jgi:hypothetical protein
MSKYTHFRDLNLKIDHLQVRRERQTQFRRPCHQSSIANFIILIVLCGTFSILNVIVKINY